VRETVEEGCGGLDGGGPIGTDALLVSVVEKDVGADTVAPGALAATCDVCDDAVGGDRLPVVAHGVPLDDFEA